MTTRMVIQALGAAALLWQLATPAAAQTQLSLGTGGTGSTSYTRGAFFSDIVNNRQPKFRLSSQATGGYRDNMGLLMNGKIDIAMATMNDIVAAYKGTGDFEKIPNKEQFQKIRRLFVLAAVPHHLMVRADSGITKITDIVGKRINLNTPASTTYGMNLRILEALGIQQNRVRGMTVATSAVFEDMQNRQMDGAFLFLDVGSARANQLARVTPLRFISYDQELIDKLNVFYDGALITYTVAANTYPQQGEPVRVFAIADSLIVHENANADMVYEVTKTFWENLDYAGQVNPEFKLLSLKEAIHNVVAPLHPGAEKYFKEKGLL